MHGEGDDAGGATSTPQFCEHRLLDNYITEEELWACTSCRACVQECPVSIDQLDIINELRRNLVLMESRFPAEMQPAFESLERNGSPWAFDPGDRAQVGGGDGHPDHGRDGRARREPGHALLGRAAWARSTTARRRSAVAFARMLQAARRAASRSSARKRSATAIPARRMGNEYLYQMLAKDNIETLDRYGVKTIVTICPHCFHQIGNEYPQLGGNYDVIHHSTYIENARGEPRAAETDEGQQLTIAYHDSLLSRPLQRRVRCAARDAQARAAVVINLVEPRAHAGARAVLRRRRRTDVDGGDAGQAHQHRAHGRAARDRRRDASPSRVRSA